MAKDMAEDYKFKLYKMTANEYARMQGYLRDCPEGSRMNKYATDRMKELEEKYPQYKLAS